jgi:hypothetical protein
MAETSLVGRKARLVASQGAGKTSPVSTSGLNASHHQYCHYPSGPRHRQHPFAASERDGSEPGSHGGRLRLHTGRAALPGHERREPHVECSELLVEWLGLRS